jgi:hypothetical protein
MRNCRVAVVMAIATAGLTGGLATSASASPPANFGQCVSEGALSPSEGTIGPVNTNSGVPDAGAVLAAFNSGGNSRWTGGGQGCGVKS